MPRLEDITGQKFHRLTVIRQAPRQKGKVHWWCLCDCGTEKSVDNSALKRGLTKSCGCLQQENRTRHGMSETITYSVWEGMIRRCNNPNHDSYKNYGDRGIKVCNSWLLFENFYADMGEKPKGFLLDRIDNDGNYTPDNCRWATWHEQMNNKRDNTFLEFDGKSQTVSQWSREKGWNRGVIHKRLKLGWSVEDTLSIPKGSRKSNQHIGRNI